MFLLIDLDTSSSPLFVSVEWRIPPNVFSVISMICLHSILSILIVSRSLPIIPAFSIYLVTLPFHLDAGGLTVVDSTFSVYHTLSFKVFHPSWHCLFTDHVMYHPKQPSANHVPSQIFRHPIVSHNSTILLSTRFQRRVRRTYFFFTTCCRPKFLT